MPIGIPQLDTAPDEHEAQIASARSDAPPDPAKVTARRDAAVSRLRAARDALADEFATVSGIESFRESQWSIIHVLGHLGADGGGHFAPVFAMLGGARELEPYEARDSKFEGWKRGAFEALDSDIAFADALSADQLVRHATKGGRPHYVIGFIEAATAHVEAHLEQLRGLKAKLAQARERRQAIAR